MPNEVVTYHEPQALDLQTQRFELEQRMARLFINSGLFSDIKGQSAEQAIAQAYVKIAMGNSMGFSPPESMTGIDLIQGKPVIGAQLRASRMQRAGYVWRVDRLDNKGCELTIFKGEELGKASFTEEDATRMQLLNKDNWKKDPQSMYFARAITRAQRRFAPGVLSLDVMSREEAFDAPDIPLPSDNGTQAMIATANRTEELKEKIKAKKETAVVEPPPWSEPGINSAPVATDIQTQKPFGKPYAGLAKWQKHILAVGGDMDESVAMAALSSIGIMSINEITEDRYQQALEALQEAKKGQGALI